MGPQDQTGNYTQYSEEVEGCSCCNDHFLHNLQFRGDYCGEWGLLRPEGSSVYGADSPKNILMISLYLKQSRTDQCQRRVKVVMGQTGCPIATLLRYLSMRGTNLGPPVYVVRWIPSQIYGKGPVSSCKGSTASQRLHRA